MTSNVNQSLNHKCFTKVKVIQKLQLVSELESYGSWSFTVSKLQVPYRELTY